MTVFRDLVLARIIEPTSKVDSLRVLAETGWSRSRYRHPEPASAGVRQTGLCVKRWLDGMRRPGRAGAGLVWCSIDVSTLYFETDAADGFREPGFSKERRLEPQITIGLLTDATGFPLAVEAFEGNKAETATMLPVINAFKTAHQLDRCHRGRRCRDDLRGQPDRHAGGRVVVHPRHPDPVRARCGARMAGQASRRGDPGRAGLHPAVAGHQSARRPAGSRTGSSTTSTATTGPGARCAGSTSRSPKPSARSTGKPRSNATGSSS